MLDIDLFEDRNTIVGDSDISDGVNEHLVHTFRSKGGPYGISNCFCGCDVVELCFFILASLRAFFEHDDRLIVSGTIHNMYLLIWVVVILFFYINIFNLISNSCNFLRNNIATTYNLKVESWLREGNSLSWSDSMYAYD